MPSNQNWNKGATYKDRGRSNLRLLALITLYHPYYNSAKIAKNLKTFSSTKQGRINKEPFLGHAAYNHYSSYYTNPLISETWQAKKCVTVNMVLSNNNSSPITYAINCTFQSLVILNNNNVSLGRVTWQLFSYNNVHVILENNNKWSICEWKNKYKIHGSTFFKMAYSTYTLG